MIRSGSELVGRGKKRTRVTLRTTIAFLICVPFVYPFYFLVVTAFKSNSDYIHNELGIPQPFVITQFLTAWRSVDLGQAMIDSTIAATVSVIVLIVLTAPAAEWCARTRSRRKSIVLGIVAVVWMVPVIIWIIPLFVELSVVHLTNSDVVLGVVYGVANAPLGLYLLYAYLGDAIDPQIREAAAVDGASPKRVFFSISLPLSLPVLSTVAVLGFVFAWGDVLIAAVLLQSSNTWTVPLAATSFTSRMGIALQAEAAAALLSMLPLAVLFVIFQKGIVRGLTVGSGR
jgi:raffinose/stachyose/melibiose transport system permease protein